VKTGTANKCINLEHQYCKLQGGDCIECNIIDKTYNTVIEFGVVNKVKATRLIKNECANFEQEWNGNSNFCVIKDKKCIQYNKSKLVCKYFVYSVMPLDKTLVAVPAVKTVICSECGTVVEDAKRQTTKTLCSDCKRIKDTERKAGYRKSKTVFTKP
jgi:hypothetical protein